VVNNFYAEPCEVELPEGVFIDGQSQRLVIGNYAGDLPRSRHLSLKPYESFVLHLSEK